MELVVNIEEFKKMSYKDFNNYLKSKYNLIYKNSEGFEGLFEWHKFKVKGKKEYFELNTDNIHELGTIGRTFLKNW